ncbi:hypothetical protein H181DRAFT_00458 [Streptomyces sp. WMMB 714]|nr:hypothetical protein H181DRAFT_00458 [Streptomyces sp. WMMB 714]
MTQAPVATAKLAAQHCSGPVGSLFESGYPLFELFHPTMKSADAIRLNSLVRGRLLMLRSVSNEGAPLARGFNEPFIAEDAQSVLHGLRGHAEPLRQLRMRGQLLAWLEHLVVDLGAERVSDLNGRQAWVVSVDGHSPELIHQHELERDAPWGLSAIAN